MAMDSYGREWELPTEELCPTCGQPDNCGDCNHTPLSEQQAKHLGCTNSVENQHWNRLKKEVDKLSTRW